MPAFSLPRPPGELALPPSPANGTFHYPTPFPPPLHWAGALLLRPKTPEGFSPSGVENGEATTSVLHSAPLHWGGPRPHSTELLRFLWEEPPPRPLRQLLGTSEGTEPIPGELGFLGAGQPTAIGTRRTRRLPVALLSGGDPRGPVPLNTCQGAGAPIFFAWWPREN